MTVTAISPRQERRSGAANGISSFQARYLTKQKARLLAPFFVPDGYDSVVHAVHEGAQLARARGMTQLAQRLGLDLADALAGDRERLADLFEGVLGAVFQAEAHLDHLLLAGGERAQDLRRLLLEVDVDHGLGRRNHRAVFDEVAQVRILFFTDRRLQRDG